MKPVTFNEQSTIFAVNQSEYLPLPAYADGRVVISKWELTWWERVKLLVTGKLWVSVLTFGRPLQPVKPQVDYPFERPDPLELVRAG